MTICLFSKRDRSQRQESIVLATAGVGANVIAANAHSTRRRLGYRYIQFFGKLAVFVSRMQQVTMTITKARCTMPQFESRKTYRSTLVHVFSDREKNEFTLVRQI